jgi:hypothetical protein
MKIMGFVCWGVSALCLWLFWFVLAPYLRGLVPAASEWAPLAKIGITVLVAWLGGIALPIVTFLWGCFFVFIGRD